MKSTNTGLKKNRFAERLVRENRLDEQGFSEWLFHPGMLFNAADKWWGKGGRRSRPHEGLDLCFYRDRHEQILCLAKDTKIPAMYTGLVVRIMDDFLGQTIILEHRFDEGKGRFYTIYGHVHPYKNIRSGDSVNEGDIIAAVSSPVRSASGILPHLHISTGLSMDVIPAEKLDWNTIGNPDILQLLDPLEVIDLKYSLSTKKQATKYK